MRAHLLARHGEHAEGIIVAQVGLGGEREVGRDPPRALQIARMHAGGVEAAAVVRHVLIGMTQRPLQPLELQRLDLVARGGLDRIELFAFGNDRGFSALTHGMLPESGGRSHAFDRHGNRSDIAAVSAESQECRAAIRSPASISPITCIPTPICAQHQSEGPLVIDRGHGRPCLRRERQGIHRGHGRACGAPRSASARSGWSRRRRADAAPALLSRLRQQIARAGRAAGGAAHRDDAGADVEGVLQQFGLRGQRHRGQDRLVLQQRARPAAQEEDHRPRARAITASPSRRRASPACPPIIAISTCRSPTSATPTARIITATPSRARARRISRPGSPTASRS